MSVVNLLILFVSVKAAFTLKDHVLGFGNLRTLLWLSVVSLPLMGVMWVLAVLSASENSQLLSLLLCVVVVIHAIFCMIGYCVINKRVRENLHRICLRCMGKKVPLLDSSMGVSNSSPNANQRNPGGFLAAGYETTPRRNIGISASSTTSRSTAKTGSSPYRSDGQLRHTSTSTSNYNSTSDMQSYVKGYESGSKQHREGGKYKRRKDSDSGSESDGRSLDLASSHSSDDEESRANTSTLQRGNAPGYLPNITEHVTASTPPELNVVQSPQLFPSVKAPLYAPRWSSQLPDAYLPPSSSVGAGMGSPGNNNLNGTNVGRWSQDTCSDNEIHPLHKPSSPHPLPNPDITDHTYLHHQKMNMPPSILENIAESYNYNNHPNNSQSPNHLNNNHNNHNNHEGMMGVYERDTYLEMKKEYPDNNNYPEFVQQMTSLSYGGGLDGKEFGSTQLVNHMRPYHQRGLMGSKTNSPYMSKEHITSELYSPQYSNGSGNNNIRSPMMYGAGDPVQSLKNEYQVSCGGALEYCRNDLQ